MDKLRKELYTLLRTPSTMEDAGRFEYFGVFSSLVEAESKRNELVSNSKGYYRVQCFRIFKEISNG